MAQRSTIGRRDKRNRNASKQIAVADWQDLPERIAALERGLEYLKVRLATMEATGAKIQAELEMGQIEAAVAPIRAATVAQQAEAEVRAAAARLEATTPHYPRA